MCNFSAAQIEQRIEKVISEQLPDNDQSEYDKCLADTEIDSLLFIQLLLALEEEFDIEFGDDMLGMSVFPSVDRIATYVRSKLKMD